MVKIYIINLETRDLQICIVSPYKFQVDFTWLSTPIYRFKNWSKRGRTFKIQTKLVPN